MAKSRSKKPVSEKFSPDIYELLREKRGGILETAAHYGFSNVRVFGSVARGEARPDSDLDLLAQPGPETSLFDHIGLEQDLEDMLGHKVDVVSEGALHWYIRDRVLAEARPL